MDLIYSGYLTIDDNQFTFFINGNQLHLISLNPKNNPFTPFKQYEYDCIYGQLTNCQYVCLIKVNVVSGFMGHLNASVMAIIKGSRNISEDISIEPFKCIRFMGDSINLFYNSLNIIDIKKTTEIRNDGSTNIVIKPYSETIKTHKLEIDSNECELIFSVSYIKKFSSKKGFAIKTDSRMELAYKKLLKCNDLLNIYLHIHNIFKFITFRKNIVFDKIQLLNESNHVIAEMIILNKIEPTNVDRNNTISYENISENIETLFKNIISSDRYTFFIPNNDNEATFVDYSSYMNTSACFEYFYKKFTKNNIATDTNIIECKDKIIQIISQLKFECLPKLIKYINDYDIDDKTLKIKFKNIMKEKTIILKSVFPKLILNSKELDNMAYYFSNQRNKIGHGDTDNLKGININPYVITLCLIYILILEESNISENMIIKIVKKIFSSYYIDKHE